MSDGPISKLNPLTSFASGDLLLVVDISDHSMSPSGTNVKAEMSDLYSFFNSSLSANFVSIAQTGNFYPSYNPSGFLPSSTFYSSGNYVQGQLNSISGGTGNFLLSSIAASTYATISNLGITGGNLQTQVNTLSGNQNSLATSSNLTSTGNFLATGKEPKITAGTSSQYWRGDKTWQTLDKTAVGLSSVENTTLSTWGGSTNITTIGTLSQLKVSGGEGFVIDPFGFTIYADNAAVIFRHQDPPTVDGLVYLPGNGTILTDSSSLNWNNLTNINSNISSLAGASSGNVIYFRGNNGSWSGANIGFGLSFTNRVLATTGLPTSGNLQTTGSNLQTQFNNLSGATGNFAANTNLISTGNNLQLQVLTLNNVTGTFPRKYSSYIGNGSSTGISVNHNLGTKDIIVSIYETGNNQEMVTADIYNTGINAFLLGFATAPTSSGLRVTVIG